MPDGPTEYCYLEQKEFPVEEFYDDQHWGRVHRTERPHTVMGDRVGKLSTVDGRKARGLDVTMDASTEDRSMSMTGVGDDEGTGDWPGPSGAPSGD